MERTAADEEGASAWGAAAAVPPSPPPAFASPTPAPAAAVEEWGTSPPVPALRDDGSMTSWAAARAPVDDGPTSARAAVPVPRDDGPTTGGGAFAAPAAAPRGRRRAGVALVALVVLTLAAALLGTRLGHRETARAAPPPAAPAARPTPADDLSGPLRDLRARVAGPARRLAAARPASAGAPEALALGSAYDRAARELAALRPGPARRDARDALARSFRRLSLGYARLRGALASDRRTAADTALRDLEQARRSAGDAARTLRR